MPCTVDARERAREARRALLAHHAIVGASLVAPSGGPRDRWTLELSILTNDADGFEPAMQRTAAEHGLTCIEVQPRSPTETRVLLAV